MSIEISDKAALRGEPSYVWRAGQQRRLEMILAVAGQRIHGTVLDNGCGVGMYVRHLQASGGRVFGLEYEYERLLHAREYSDLLACAAGENLPYPADSFDLVLSHEVLEHVADDRQAVLEIVRTLKPGGRLVLFVPNRGYPFETHGIYWRGKYHFGNMPLVNYLPRSWRNKLAPHVRVYSRRDLVAPVCRSAGKDGEADRPVRGLRQHHRPHWNIGEIHALVPAGSRKNARCVGWGFRIFGCWRKPYNGKTGLVL